MKKILFVDDDPNILSAYQRQFRKQFHIETALGGDLGLAAIANHGPYGVIVADMLSQLGCIMTPEEILVKVCNGTNLSESESKIFKTHPQIGSDLISNIPDLKQWQKL